ncbi:hypothetical protein SAMN05421788_1251 [Filimonas lacunae]|uniref:Uncharacterized protein n=1 Tax=Filimonas lacunae TaxID=477680 RepID=A0A1N7RIA2_9BACT|nr:hypothetical protein SAMN05421788_1251 [Filimonas lacunae]
MTYIQQLNIFVLILVCQIKYYLIHLNFRIVVKLFDCIINIANELIPIFAGVYLLNLPQLRPQVSSRLGNLYSFGIFILAFSSIKKIPLAFSKSN